MSESKTFTIFEGDTAYHINIIEELRSHLSTVVNTSLTDHDCLRFLRARQGNVPKSVQMVTAWHIWRHTLLEPLPPGNNIQLSPNIILCKYEQTQALLRLLDQLSL